MNNVNKTLYIPLYGKAYVSKKGIILKDEKAEEIWEKEGFALNGRSRSKWLAYYMGMRSAVFDSWLKQRMTETDDAVVIHIGCGMDSRVTRVGTMGHKWYDIDFAEVIEERKRYFVSGDGYEMLACDIRDNKWLMDIPERNTAIVVMEGVSMYLNTKELQDMFLSLSLWFERITLLMDCYSAFAAKMSKYKNPINDVGVTAVYGIDDPYILDNTDLRFAVEHNMTPQELIDELTGTEKKIFQKLYAGSFSKKLYKLYEYKK